MDAVSEAIAAIEESKVPGALEQEPTEPTEARAPGSDAPSDLFCKPGAPGKPGVGLLGWRSERSRRRRDNNYFHPRLGTLVRDDSVVGVVFPDVVRVP
jgi:hypothetical protein